MTPQYFKVAPRSLTSPYYSRKVIKVGRIIRGNACEENELKFIWLEAERKFAQGNNRAVFLIPHDYIKTVFSFCIIIAEREYIARI